MLTAAALALTLAAGAVPPLVDAVKSGRRRHGARAGGQGRGRQRAGAGRHDGPALGGAAQRRGPGVAAAARRRQGERQELVRRVADVRGGARGQSGADRPAAGGWRRRGVAERRRPDGADGGGEDGPGGSGARAAEEGRQGQRGGEVARPDGADVGGGAGPHGDGQGADRQRRGRQRALHRQRLGPPGHGRAARGLSPGGRPDAAPVRGARRVRGLRGPAGQRRRRHQLRGPGGDHAAPDGGDEHAVRHGGGS